MVFFREHMWIALIILIFLSLQLLKYDGKASLWWDSSVYINIGKYIYSGGESGLYEETRPLLWPLLLGLYWKLGFNPILFGKITLMLFGCGSILLTYLIAKKVFNKKTAIIASLMLSLSPTFFLFNSILFTSIPSAFFLLLGLYYFLDQKYSYAGFWFGISFMTRFFQIFMISLIFIFLVSLVISKKKSFKELAQMLIFFSIPVVPYLIFIIFRYGNPIYPFLLQAWMVEHTGWIFHQDRGYYFIELIKENFLIMFLVLGIFFVSLKKRTYPIFFVYLLSITFILYLLQPHKELRFLISLFPIIYIISAYGITEISGKLGKYKNLGILILIIPWLFLNTPDLKSNSYKDGLDEFYKFIDSENMRGNIWISNPSFIVYSTLRSDELIYYPLYDEKKIEYLSENIQNADYVLMNTCDILPCPPSEKHCESKHEAFLELMQNSLILKHSFQKSNCGQYIFTSS
jgi:hypothetical protein